MVLGHEGAGVIEEVGAGVDGFPPGDEVIGFTDKRASQAELVLVEAVAYGDGAADRIRAAVPGGVDAFIDTHGDGYVELSLALGVAAGRIETIVDYAAAQKHGVKTDGGQRLARPLRRRLNA
jgi:NADPH:quinone reductase-like Zn-dependent oxidoreductase